MPELRAEIKHVHVFVIQSYFEFTQWKWIFKKQLQVTGDNFHIQEYVLKEISHIFRK